MQLQMAAQVVIHLQDRPVIGPVGPALTLGARLLLNRNFWLEPAERAKKIPSRAENARLSGSQVYYSYVKIALTRTNNILQLHYYYQH